MGWGVLSSEFALRIVRSLSIDRQAGKLNETIYLKSFSGLGFSLLISMLEWKVHSMNKAPKSIDFYTFLKDQKSYN